jgi:hypothetical protein
MSGAQDQGCQRNAGTFNPAAWLDAYTAAGGTYALSGDGSLWLGKFDHRATIEPHTAELLSDPERVAAFKAMLRERCLIAG